MRPQSDVVRDHEDDSGSGLGHLSPQIQTSINNHNQVIQHSRVVCLENRSMRL